VLVLVPSMGLIGFFFEFLVGIWVGQAVPTFNITGDNY